MKILYINTFIYNRFLSKLNEQGSEVMQNSNEHSQKKIVPPVFQLISLTACLQLQHAVLMNCLQKG